MFESSKHLQEARQLTGNAAALLGQSHAFRQLEPHTREAIARDLETIHRALNPPPADPYALALETPNDFRQRRFGAPAAGANPAQPAATAPAGPPAQPAPKSAATETIARRAGALSDEIDFPAFVASLVHGTFDAMVDASIRQMEAFANLVSAVAKDVEQFTEENVTPNQVRDFLAQQYPRDLVLDIPSPQAGTGPQLRRRNPENPDETPPAWLADFGLSGQQLTNELIEGPLLENARTKVGEDRLHLLATMVLLGMNRINVKDGTISAKVRFRASAQDKAHVDYAVTQDPGGQTWAERGSAVYSQASTMVSTVGVNVQADSELKAELFGEVVINFVSETLPLERFADSAKLTLLRRHARSDAPAVGSGVTATPALPGPTEAAPQPAVTPTAPAIAPAVPSPAPTPHPATVGTGRTP